MAQNANCPLAEARLRPSLGLPKWQSPEHLLLLKGEVRSSSTTPLTALRYWAPHWSAKGHARPSDADASRAATVTHRRRDCDAIRNLIDIETNDLDAYRHMAFASRLPSHSASLHFSMPDARTLFFTLVHIERYASIATVQKAVATLGN